MEPNADQPKAPESKPGSKPNAKDDLKSVPMPELQAKLVSSPDGLSQAEAQKRLTQYGPNEIEEKITNPFLEFPRARGELPLRSVGRAHLRAALQQSAPTVGQELRRNDDPRSGAQPAAKRRLSLRNLEQPRLLPPMACVVLPSEKVATPTIIVWLVNMGEGGCDRCLAEGDDGLRRDRGGRRAGRVHGGL
jgi:hypothetical protein